MGGIWCQGSWSIHHFQWVDFLGLPSYITLAFPVSSMACVLAWGVSVSQAVTSSRLCRVLSWGKSLLQTSGFSVSVYAQWVVAGCPQRSISACESRVSYLSNVCLVTLCVA